MISAGLPIACGLNGSTGYFQPRAASAASPVQAVALAQQDDRDVAAARREFGRRHKTVAAIVAAAGDHHDRPLLDEVHRGFGNGLPCAHHQREAGRAGGNGQPIGALHLTPWSELPCQILNPIAFSRGISVVAQTAYFPSIAYQLICLPI